MAVNALLGVSVSVLQAARQAAREKKAELKEVSQVAAPPPAAEALPDPSVKKLPVGSSIHVDYNYFEVGTGQVNFKRNKGFMFKLILSFS